MQRVMLFIVTISTLSVNLIEIVDSFQLYKRENHSDPVVHSGFLPYKLRECVNLVDGYKSVRSVDTKMDCVQLYDKKDCKGRYVKIESDTFKYNNLKELNFDTVSMGTCWNIVKLYDQRNYDGRRLRIGLWGNNDCITLRGRERVVNSLKIKGSCLSLYKDDSCTKILTEVMDRKADTSGVGLVRSIGRCSGQYTDDNKFGKIQLNPSVISPGELMLGQFVRSENAVVIKTHGVPQDHYCELARRCHKNRLVDCQIMKSATTCYCHIDKRFVFCDTWRPPNWVRVTLTYKPMENPLHSTRETLVGEIQDKRIAIGSGSYKTPYVNTEELKRRCQNDANSNAVPGRTLGGVMSFCGDNWCYPNDLPKSMISCSSSSPTIPRNVKVIEADEDFEYFSYN